MKKTTCALAGASFAAFASIASAAQEATLPGWESDFAAATNLAVTARRPLVLVWGNIGCSHCAALEDDLAASAFTQWKADKEYVFCFVLGKNGKDPGGGTAAREFAATAGGTKRNDLPSYPYVCLYWPKGGGAVAASSFTTESAAAVSASADKLFDGYVPAPEYLGGDLAFTGEYANARLEAEAGFTEWVDVPLARDGAATPYAATNVVAATLGGAEIQRTRVVWGVNEGERLVRVAIPGGAKAGDTIAVALTDDGGNARGSVGIHVVGARDNSAKNPLFLGERTAATLGYGEWTMDLDVAMEKFKAEPGSKLLAAAVGSLWCPDCVMTDRHFLENPAFKAWAVENKVILVDIDVPNFPNTTNSACLLTRVVGRTSDGYISGRGTLATNELERYQSGAGYLSRHMVGDADAAKVLARNRSLVGRNTLEGGWNDPDRANQNRTGIPNFFALRRDGSLAGAFETFNTLGPVEFKQAYIDRFTELVALCDDASGDFANRSWQTTDDECAGDGETAGTLSAIDLVDTYRLAATKEPAAEQTVTVRGTDAGTTVTVSLIAVVDGTQKTLATATGSLADGVTASGVVSSAGDYYVAVAGDGTGSLAADSAAAVTTTAYTIAAARRAVENPFQNDWTARAAATTLPLYADDGATLEGTLALTLKKNGRISAKYSNGKKTVASFSGRWDEDIAADGTATATLEKKGWTLSLVMGADGEIAARVDDGSAALESCECALAESYGAFAGVYTVAMPSRPASLPAAVPAGNAVMTLKMANTKSAASKGQFRYKVYLPDGKTLAGTSNVTWIDADFGIVPVLKTSGANTFAATLKVRRDAGRAESARAVLALDGTSAVWTGAAAGSPFTRSFDIRGSWYDKGASMLTGMADESLALAFAPDAAALAESPSYGALLSIAGDGAAVTVTAEKAAAEKISGFSFKVNKSTGVVSGSARLTFEGKARVSAKWTGVLLRGWFSDCDCGEDADPLIEMQNVAFATGFCLFADKIDRKTVKRSFPVNVK